ncbi:hypothetical protein D3C73_1550320 [compost metagenome]
MLKYRDAAVSWPILWAIPPTILIPMALSRFRPTNSRNHIAAKLNSAPMMLNKKLENVPNINAVSSVLSKTIINASLALRK